MTTKHVFDDLITIVEGLTPTTTVSDGEPNYLYVERQADDLTIDRTFSLFSTGQEHANPLGGYGATQRWLTTFEVEMYHKIGKRRQDGLDRMLEDRDQLLKELGEIGNYDQTYTDAILRETMRAMTTEDNGVSTTTISFTLHHHE